MSEMPVSYVSVTPREVFTFFETEEHLQKARAVCANSATIESGAHPHVLCVADVGITAYEALERLSGHFRLVLHPKAAGRREDNLVWGFPLARSIEGAWIAPDIAGWDLDSWGDWDKTGEPQIDY